MSAHVAAERVGIPSTHKKLNRPVDGAIRLRQDVLMGRPFESANPDFFIAHYGASGPRSRFGVPRWIDAATRLANSGVLSIAVIRGRVRGGGSEFALGCDIRFASREKAIFGQPEVGTGLIPGGGALQRLPLLVGRSRALEIVMGASDFDADTAERYGWINRAMPDAELDAFVANFVGRVLAFVGRRCTRLSRSSTTPAYPTRLHCSRPRIFFSSLSHGKARKSDCRSCGSAASDGLEILSWTSGVTSPACNAGVPEIGLRRL